jgi:hypothetical protein
MRTCGEWSYSPISFHSRSTGRKWSPGTHPVGSRTVWTMFRRGKVRKVENRTAAHRCIDLTATATALNTSDVKRVSIAVKSLTSVMSIARANPIVAMDVCLKCLSMLSCLIASVV